ncbi:peptidoglycan DD-metalloendopeptidase family protein [Pseudoxanthobacter sp.]|uniref:peptidoglycan DD-metalloendopeptidase family protein n=1 Tax=Pseudoxanthobacter sp. TaxID=1925742 RepID=UPI002FE0B1CA
MRTASVTATPLPPPSAVTSQPLPAPGAVAAGAVASVAPAAAAAAAPAMSGTYQGWSAVGGTVLTAGAGDTPTSLAQRYGVPVNAIMSVNGLSDAYGALNGRRVTIPTFTSGTATQVASDAAKAAIPAPAGGYVVTPGETLYSVARKYQVSPAALAAANGLTTDSQIKIGQSLQIPTGAAATATKVASVMPVPAPATAAATATDAAQQTLAAGASTLQAEAAKVANPAAPPAPPAGQQVASLPSAAGSAAKTATDAAAASAPEEEAGSGFRWPVRGRIIAGFGKKSNGEQNDGINIAVPEGTPVKAAEAGTVIYAGNELSGFGNLVLVRHEGGWVTAYAHNKELLVRRGETVKRGQTIGYAGATGSVSQPQVHFELRKGSQPVDPLPHLAGA